MTKRAAKQWSTSSDPSRLDNDRQTSACELVEQHREERTIRRPILDEVDDQTWFGRCGLRRTHDPSLSHRPRFGCLLGTFSPSPAR